MTKYDEVMMESALLWAKESYCVKKQVGAILALDSRIIATGYNGTVNGQPNVCEILEQISCPRCNGIGKLDIPRVGYTGRPKPLRQEECSNCYGRGCVERKVTSDFTVHAEQNIISYCAKSGIATEGATIYITLSPCKLCAKLIVQSGIKRVVYLEPYRDLSGVEFLEDCGIEVEKYNEK